MMVNSNYIQLGLVKPKNLVIGPTIIGNPKCSKCKWKHTENLNLITDFMMQSYLFANDDRES